MAALGGSLISILEAAQLEQRLESDPFDHSARATLLGNDRRTVKNARNKWYKTQFANEETLWRVKAFCRWHAEHPIHSGI